MFAERVALVDSPLCSASLFICIFFWNGRTSLQSSAASSGNTNDEDLEAEEGAVGASSSSAFGAFANKELGDDEASSDEEERNADQVSCNSFSGMSHLLWRPHE